MERWVRSVRDALRRPWGRLFATPFSIPRIGIAGRLGISFAAVGILAAITNLLIEQGVAIVERSRAGIASLPLTSGTQDPVARLPPMTLPANSVAQAIDQYDRAIAARVRLASIENRMQLASAVQVLDAELASFLPRAAVIPGVSLREFNAALSRYREAGTELVEIADRRSEAIVRYAADLELIHDRARTSVDGAWRIMGRVIARQSLLQLRNEQDEIRRAFAALLATEALSEAAVNELEASEAAFGATLSANERSLARSQSREWVGAMQRDYEAMLGSREAFLAHWRRQDTLSEHLGNTRLLLGRALAGVTEQIDARAARVSADVFGATPQERSDLLIPLASPVERTTLAASGIDDTRGALIAWVSAGTLAIVLFISIRTVYSIVVPIRRLLAATAQLASGNLAAPVPRGGIKELDTLAVSFNEMASQLAAARRNTEDHQRELESRVHDRTRQLQELAEHDPLTGLPNRRHLSKMLNAALQAAQANGLLVGVFFVDLDNFKNINDSMGHAYGDRVLKGIAERLQFLTLDCGFAARLGGDEFTVVITGCRVADEIDRAGLRIIQAFQNPIALDNRDLVISVSAGASVYPHHERTAEGLLRAADAALFRAKALGRSQLAVFTPELLAAAAAKFSTEQGLRRAVERGEFELYFQPEISVDTLQTALVEALIRWRLPDGRLLAPGEFLGVAEESGLIGEIGDWVLRSAIEAAAKWHHGAWPDARVAINVSPRQLLDQGFVERIERLLAEFALPAHCIEIELTESVLQTGPATIETLHRLRALGIAIALDDFGTGYSSLASLEQLPITRIKLDRSLIASIDSNVRSATISKAIIGLCHGLGLEVTAEGIERPEQFAMLASCRPMTLQGYLFAKPVAGADLLGVMEQVAAAMPLLVLTARHEGEDTRLRRSGRNSRSA